jgi:hypothetical protein
MAITAHHDVKVFETDTKRAFLYEKHDPQGPVLVTNQELEWILSHLRSLWISSCEQREDEIHDS